MNEILNADDLFLTSETIENLQENFLKWKIGFERKTIKVNIKKKKSVGVRIRKNTK